MKPNAKYNFYHIDDVLIRTGLITALIVIVLVANDKIAFSLANPLLYACVLPPLAFLLIGFAVRRREKRTLAIWRTLDRNVSTRVPELLSNSSFTRRELMQAVQLLNDRGLGFYVWQRDSDTISDARLGDEYIHLENCESCGAPVGLKVSLALHDVPRCPYCHAAATSHHLNLLKRDAIAELRGTVRPGRAHGIPVRRGQSAMSIPFFIVLLIFFWPAAIAYSIYKSRSHL